MKKLIYAAALAVMFVAGVSAETKQAVYTVNPQMSCQNCENKIKSNLRYEKGIKKIETSLSDQTVTVTYDDTKTDSEKIAAGFKKVGYTAVTADGKGAATKQCGKSTQGCCKNSQAQAKCENKCNSSQAEAKCESKCKNSGEHKCKNSCENTKDHKCKNHCKNHK